MHLSIYTNMHPLNTQDPRLPIAQKKNTLKPCPDKMKMLKLKATLMFIIVASMVAFVSSNFTKDRQECQNQLITLSSCLNYVAGEAVRPSPQCCAILDQRINQTKRCLCILVRDRNEPSLGLKLNATRAVRLPTVCHANNNPLECLGMFSCSLLVFFLFLYMSCLFSCRP